MLHWSNEFRVHLPNVKPATPRKVRSVTNFMLEFFFRTQKCQISFVQGSSSLSRMICFKIFTSLLWVQIHFFFDMLLVKRRSLGAPHVERLCQLYCSHVFWVWLEKLIKFDLWQILIIWILITSETKLFQRQTRVTRPINK